MDEWRNTTVGYSVDYVEKHYILLFVSKSLFTTVTFIFCELEGIILFIFWYYGIGIIVYYIAHQDIIFNVYILVDQMVFRF